MYSKIDEVERLRAQSKFNAMKDLRHPDFKAAGKAAIVNPDLQGRGSWTKLRTQKGPRPKGRFGFSSWIWKGSLYIFSGHDHANHMELIDLWYEAIV